MHKVTKTDRGLTTRWTLQFRFRLLPWQPLAQFTGVSEYTLDKQARVLRQQDYWDSINLRDGRYAPVSKLAGLADFVGQLKPGSGDPPTSDKSLPFTLLRRAADYEVRAYPEHVAARTEYLQRMDGFSTLVAYTKGANTAVDDLQPYRPSIISVPADSRSLEQLKDDAYNEVVSTTPKTMRWPMAVPALNEAAPPEPAGRLDGVAALETVPRRVVGVLRFTDPTTEVNTRAFGNLLAKRLFEDGLLASRSLADGFSLAQYEGPLDGTVNEVWIDLPEGHPW
jgi:hypothetical protein